MAKSNRDDFPPVVIRKLKERYNLLCCNPDCGATTSCPNQNDDEKSVCIGKAAHICAAAPGGPRYDETMTREQRRGINNAIWLCGPCADKIDKDEKAYPKELLSQWKIAAATSLINGLGRKLPKTTDAIDTMLMAMSGAPKSIILDAIPNVFTATTQSLEKLDPRFNIKASHHENVTSFIMLAKENVPFKMIVAGGYKEEFIHKFDQLIKHGETLEIDSAAIRLDGSKLLEFIASDMPSAKFILSSTVTKNAVQKLWLKSLETQEVFYVDDIHGVISAGEKSFNFTGNAYGGLLELKYSNTFTTDKTGQLTFTITIDYKKWDKLSLSALPYLGKIRQLFTYLAKGCELNTKLEIDGLDIFSACDPNYKGTEAFTNFYVYCDYLSLAGSVFSLLGKNVLHDSKYAYSREIHELLFLINKTLSGESIYSDDDYKTTLTCTFTAEDDLENVKTITKTAEPRAIRMDQNFGGSLEIFGETIQLPRSYLVISSVIPRITPPAETIRPGDEFFVEWISQDDCQLLTGFLYDAE